MNARAKKTAALFLIPVLMFGFGYLLVPIYDIFCELTGLNGKTGTVTVQRVGRMQVDESRLVTVEFMANLNRDTPLDFAPTVASMAVHPGKPYQTTYHARNLDAATMTGQAVPSVSPARASIYFNKVECFCFGQQDFTAHESRELPVRFVIHPDLPKNIETVTLSYTFFQVDGNGGGGGEHEDEHEDKRDHSDHDHDHSVKTASASTQPTDL